jgi:hypothetical protein
MAASYRAPRRKGAKPQEQRIERAVAASLSAAQLTYSLQRRDSDFVVFCFAKSKDSDSVAERFGEDRSATGSRGDPKNKRTSGATWLQQLQSMGHVTDLH